MSAPLLLENSIRAYAWGSRTALAELQGREPGTEPEAELWVGAYARSPSRVAGSRETLPERIALDPVAHLGAEVARRYDEGLPFLLKVLAVDAPLSLQAHPSRRQAVEGFAREERDGVPRDAPDRSYRDANHKPEVICALTPFDALYGFRAVEDTVRLLAGFGVPAVTALMESLPASEADGGSAALRELFTRVVGLRGAAGAELLDAVATACREDRGEPGFAAERAVGLRLALAYPGDVGVLSALMLNLVHLEPGEALYVPAGNLHAYLGGIGVEVMACSDNVLRGGLTPKHVDLPELLRVLDFHAEAPCPWRPVAVEGSPERAWRTPAPDFRLSVVEVAGGPCALDRRVSLLLCTAGTVTVHTEAGSVDLARGAAAYVPDCAAELRLTGYGTVYRATVNDRDKNPDTGPGSPAGGTGP